jgi:hypothetical protein
MLFARCLAATAALAILFGVGLVNQVEPLVLGMPLVLAWLVIWVVIGAGAMGLIYALDPINATETNGEGGER